jgi:hypothetical protein
MILRNHPSETAAKNVCALAQPVAEQRIASLNPPKLS